MNRKNFAIGTLVVLVFVVFGGFIGTFGQEVVPVPGDTPPNPNLTTKTILKLQPKKFSAIQKIRLSYLVGLGDSQSSDLSSKFKLSKLGVSTGHQILTVVKCTGWDCNTQSPKNTSKDLVSSIFGGVDNSVGSQREGSTIVGGSNNFLSGASANSFIGGSNTTQLRGDNSAILGSSDSSLIGNQSTIIGGMSNNTIQGNNVSILGGSDVSVQANNSFAIGKKITITHDGVFAFNVRSEPLISQRPHTFLIMANRGLVINSDKPNTSSLIGLTVNGNIKIGYEAQNANKQGALVRRTCTSGIYNQLENSCLCSYGSGNNKTTLSTSSTMCQLLCDSNKANGSPCPKVNGQCDPKRSRVFPSSATDRPVDSFYCSAGNQNRSVRFPDPGGVVEWRCVGFGPNAVTENCTAKRVESQDGFCKELTLIAGTTNINNLLGSDFCESGDFINLVLTGGSHGDYIAKWTCAGMSSIPSGGGPLPNPIPNGTISSHCVAICPTGTYFQGGVCQVPDTTVIDGQCAAVTLGKGSPNLMTLKNHNFLCASGYAEGGPWNNGEGTAHWICKGRNGGLDVSCSANCPSGTVLRGNICTDGSSPSNCKEIVLKEGSPNLEKMGHLDFCMTGSPTETDWEDGKTIATWKCGEQSCASTECPTGTAFSGGVCRSPTTPPEDPPFCIPEGNTCANTSECCPNLSCDLSTYTCVNKDGICGPADSGWFLSGTKIPKSDLCGGGVVPYWGVLLGSGFWKWECLGIDGGVTASCQAGMKGQCDMSITSMECADGSTGGCKVGWVEECTPVGEGASWYCQGTGGVLGGGRSLKCSGESIALW